MALLISKYSYGDSAPGSRFQNRRLIECLLIILLPAWTAAATNSSNFGLGPFLVKSLSPFQILYPEPGPDIPRRPRAGRVAAQTSITRANYWCYSENEYLIDGELLYCMNRIEYDITNRCTISLEVPAGMTISGSLDTMIEDFHDTFGLGQAERDRFESGASDFWINLPDGTRYSPPPFADGMTARGTEVALYYMISEGSLNRPAVFLGGTLLNSAPSVPEHPAGDTDVGLMLALNKGLGRWIIYSNFSIAYRPEETASALHINTWRGSLMLAAEWRHTADSSFIVQYLVSSPTVRDLYEFDRPTHECVVGLKKVFNRTYTLECGILENLFIFSNSPDFGLHVGLSRMF